MPAKSARQNVRTDIFAAFLAVCLCMVSAARADTPEVNILSMGDWGMASKAQADVAKSMSGYVTKTARPFSAMLLVGDNFYMDLSGVDDPHWRTVFETMYDPATLNFPFYAVLGNHDYQNGKGLPPKADIELSYAKLHPDSRWKIPARWYREDLPSADHPLVTVLMLDSDHDDLSKDQWEAQKKWMDAELSKPRSAAWVLCCAHHPIFSNGGHGDNGVLQKDWGPIIGTHHVDFYVCGHDHDLQHLQVPAWWTSFVLVGGGGADTKMMRRSDRGPMSRLINGFGHFDFTPELATVSFIDRDGTVIHEFTRDRATGKVNVIVSGGTDPAAKSPLRALEGFGPVYNPPPATTQPIPAP